MDSEPVENNSFLNDLIAKRQIMSSNNPNALNSNVDYSSSTRNKLQIKNIYKEKKESYQPQAGMSIGPIRPEILNQASDSESDSDSEDSFLEKCKDIDFDEKNLPFTHETRFSDHTKTIQAIAIDRAACRMVTSSADEYIKYWDFANMSQSRKPFRSLEPRAG
jgi:WD40 repeat protein